jgi:oxygen-independent coproporphyrinogen-3 oxidase
VVLTDDDRLRGDVIARMMCDFAVDLGQVAARHKVLPSVFDDDRLRLQRLVADGLVVVNGDRIALTPQGRPFVRLAAQAFDRRSTDDGGFSRVV